MAEPARTLAMGQDEATGGGRADRRRAVRPRAGRRSAATRPEIVGLTADLGKYTDILPFRDAFPDRFFNVGMAEQNLVAVAAGLARTGKMPFATTYGVFATRRAYDFIAIALAHSNLNVKIVAGLPGLTTGYGGTHQAIEDLALMRMIPGLAVIDPCDATEIAAATAAIADHRRPGLHAAPARRGAGRARPRLPLRDRQGARASRRQGRRHRLDRPDDRARARRRRPPRRARHRRRRAARADDQAVRRRGRRRLRRVASTASSPPRTTSSSAASRASSSRRCSTRHLPSR